VLAVAAVENPAGLLPGFFDNVKRGQVSAANVLVSEINLNSGTELAYAAQRQRTRLTVRP
jgi:hypothetical protein